MYGSGSARCTAFNSRIGVCWGPMCDELFNRCVSVLHDMARVASHGRAFRVEFLGQVAQRYVQYFRASGSRFGCMRAIETALGAPRVKATRIRFRFGRKKDFSGVEQLAAIAEYGAPVHVEGDTEIGAALAYSNQSIAAPHSDSILAKTFDDVRFGRAVIVPRSEAHTIHDLRLSPLRVVVSPSRTGLSTTRRSRCLRAHTASTPTPISNKRLL